MTVELAADMPSQDRRQKHPRFATCKACGKTFEPRPNARGTAKVCDRKCQGVLTRMRSMERRHRDWYWPNDAGQPVRRIPVGKGLYALVDASDYEAVAAIPWGTITNRSGKTYAYTTGGRTYMHRMLAGTPPGRETDHINGDGLDNRRSNLRIATMGQNSANSRKPRIARVATSQYKGVCWTSRGWQANITVNRVSRTLGRFKSEADAARAYDRAALAAWGEFALINGVPR